MKTHLKILVSLLIIILTINQAVAQEATKAHKDSLEIIVKKYYELNLKIFQADSNVEDIDKTFELFTDDFTYVHPKYGGTYTREDLYNGYVRNQKNGGYDGKVTDIKVLNKIVGLNAVVTQKCFVEKKDGKIKDGEPEMTLFEFRNGKILRIFEYW
ncbi:nuclear transport factor 2 family protein [Psychroserpens sp. Hel_I_66]|uniref:nuclear transport factor 2 family protein n=1 Tax=Psychroserpens sp. Hel_I_66 TaxID=1250004 RepID=UPI000647B7A6|nr:nuclear transport factor 2 family protein [Psychroserpens sp. Hel_I_66]